MADYNPLSYVRKYVTDPLGITNPAPPDLSQGPDAQRVRQAADVFYNQYKGLTPSPAPVISAPTATDRTGQQQALAAARAAAEGSVPSAAQAQLRRGVDEGVSNALGMAATLQGSRPGLALGAGLTAGQKAISSAGADAATLRAQEQAAGRAQLIDAANAFRSADIGERGQDIGVATTNAGNALQSRGLDINERLGLGNLMASSALAPYNTAVANQQLQLQNQAANQAAIGTLAGAGAYGLAKSDERDKTDIKASPESADAFLSSLEPKTFRYKDPGAPGQYPGDQLGVIAQDLAGGVTTGPDGKKWLSADVIGRVLAGLGRLNEKVEGSK